MHGWGTNEPSTLNRSTVNFCFCARPVFGLTLRYVTRLLGMRAWQNRQLFVNLKVVVRTGKGFGRVPGLIKKAYTPPKQVSVPHSEINNNPLGNKSKHTHILKYRGTSCRVHANGIVPCNTLMCSTIYHKQMKVCILWTVFTLCNLSLAELDFTIHYDSG